MTLVAIKLVELARCVFRDVERNIVLTQTADIDRHNKITMGW